LSSLTLSLIPPHRPTLFPQFFSSGQLHLIPAAVLSFHLYNKVAFNKHCFRLAQGGDSGGGYMNSPGYGNSQQPSQQRASESVIKNI